MKLIKLMMFWMFYSSLSFSETYTKNGTCIVAGYKDISICNEYNIGVVKKDLIEIENVFLAKLNEEDQIIFKKSQSDWLKHSTSNCHLNHLSQKDGSLSHIHQQACELHAMEQRLRELRCLYSYHLNDGNQYQKYCVKYYQTRDI